ncbi:MAG: hypothetical protein SGCHY_000859 [Lobulomycetales sp.]
MINELLQRSERDSVLRKRTPLAEPGTENDSMKPPFASSAATEKESENVSMKAAFVYSDTIHSASTSSDTLNGASVSSESTQNNKQTTDRPSSTSTNDSAAPSEHPAPKQGEPSPEEKKTCRLCFSDETEPGDKMISPCKCKGTMKYIHLNCLNEWRRVSQKRDSYFKCDQCGYKYRLGRTGLAKLVVNEAVVTLLTLCIFAVTTFAMGFLTKFILIWLTGDTQEIYAELGYDPANIPLHERDAMYYIEQVLTPTSLWSVDFSHMLSGLLGLGLAGSASLFFSVFTGGPMFPRVGIYRDRGGSAGMIVLGIIVVIGIGKTFYSMYKYVKNVSKLGLEIVEDFILEVD